MSTPSIDPEARQRRIRSINDDFFDDNDNNTVFSHNDTYNDNEDIL